MIVVGDDGKKTYSDGNIIESNIIESLRTHTEKQIREELATSYEYTLDNTFSEVRENFFKSNATVLEIGAGMGSITGLLCRKCKHVVSVELSETRAQIIRERFKDQKNLEVYTDNINDLALDLKFDYVVFVGVLEYAQCFSDSNKPFHEFINS